MDRILLGGMGQILVVLVASVEGEGLSRLQRDAAAAAARGGHVGWARSG